MKKRWPRLSVMVVTRNRASRLRACIDRILEDDYPERELLVVDGASTDGTVDLLKSYGDRITRWISEPDRGEYDAWNKVTALATGEVFKWVPDDDLLRPGAARKAVSWLDAHPDVDVVFGQTAMWVDSGGRRELQGETRVTDVSRLTLRHFLRQTHGVTSVGPFLRRRAVERLGPFATDMACADTEYWARAAAAGVRMGLIPDVVMDYTLTGQNLQSLLNWRISVDLVRINARYGTLADAAAMAWERRKSLLGVPTMIRLAAIPFHRLGLHPWRWARDRLARVRGDHPG